MIVIAAVSLAAGGPSKAPKLDALTHDAEVIVVGKVGHITSAWADGKSRIETQISVSINETIKGDAPGNTITVVVPGGEVDGVGEWYSHSAKFGQDEDVVLFAKKDTGGRYRVAGGEHGKLTISKDARTANRFSILPDDRSFTDSILRSQKTF